MFTSELRSLTRKLATLTVLILCLTGLAYTPGANTSQRKAICCSLCNGEPTDPGACHYGCNERC